MRTRGSPVAVSPAQPETHSVATTRPKPNVMRVIGTSSSGKPKGEPKIAPPSVLEQGRSDHEALYLARALVDLGDLGVAEVPLGREIPEVAVTAEDLQGLLGDAVRDLRGEQLGHGG